jgi:deazaflavin-dependent oxidoreductase (nitroreductase family)
VSETYREFPAVAIVGVHVIDNETATETELSPKSWVRELTQEILERGTTEGSDYQGRPVVLFTITGAKSGKKRYVPLMRVEADGKYAMVGSNGAGTTNPSWYYNIKANPTVTVQDGAKVVTLDARELDGAEREKWWTLAVESFPQYAEFQSQTDRRLPVFVLE